MKKNIFALFLAVFAMITVSSCKDERGTEPGNDSQPVATLYKYAAELPNNADNDVRIRVATNSVVKEVYYFAEKTETYKSNLASMGEDGYKNYVIEKGTKVNDLAGNSDKDFMLTGMFGSYTIAAVAVNGSSKTLSSIEFVGLIWSDIVKGQYYFAEKLYAAIPALSEPKEVVLQKCDNQDGLYRFKDLYGPGFDRKFYDSGETDEDENEEEYKLVYARSANTPFTYGSYGAVSTRDVYTWQGDNADYLNGEMYDDGYVALWMQYYVAAGNLGYGWEYFVPYK